jgi:predicted  nucleic acid-binding Zn-ribbon protein
MGETKSEPEKSSNAEAANEAQDEIAGRDVLILLRRSAELADGNNRYAVEIAQEMSDQLWAAQKRAAELRARIAELEAQVQLYRNKSETAEQWLGKISSEIQQRVLGGDN